jgi:hypothetical protein
VGPTSMYAQCPDEFLRDYCAQIGPKNIKAGHYAGAAGYPGDKHIANGSEFTFSNVPCVVFMDNTALAGEKIKAYIEEHKLGLVTQSPRASNVNHSGRGKEHSMFIWNPDRLNLAKWAKEHVPETYWAQVQLDQKKTSFL